MDDGLKKNDPYRGMQSGKEDIRPGFLKGLFKDKDKAGEVQNDKKAAADDLKSVEKTAEGASRENAEDTLDGARSKEENADGFYSGAGDQKGKKNSRGLKARLVKSGPAWAIFGLISGVGAMMMGAQTLMPIAIQEMIIQKFNSIGVSSTIVSDSWLDSQLNSGVRDQNLKQGDTDNLLAFSPYQVKELRKHGITVIEDVGIDSTPVMALLFRDGDEYVPVVGSNNIGKPGLLEAIKEKSGFSNVRAPISAKEALANLEFKDSYTDASKAWRGGSSGWYDKIMTDITEAKLSVKRNRWARFLARSLGEMTEDFKKKAASSIKNRTSDFEDALEIENYTLDEGDTFVDDDGITMTVKEVRIEEVVDPDTGEVIDEIRYIKANNAETVVDAASMSKLESVLNSKAVKAAAGVADGLDMGCAIVEGLMSIYTLVSAYQSLQFLNLISGYLEAVDKVKAGDGSESPIHTYNNNLTTKADTVAVDADGSASTSSMGGTESKVVATKTAMESAGMANLFSDVKINSKDQSVQNVNIEGIMSGLSGLTGNIAITAKVFEACGYVKIATAGVNLVLTTLSFIPIFGGAVKFAKIGVSTLVKLGIKAGVTLFFYAAIPIIAKKVAKVLIKDAATEWFGEDLGNAMISGASKYLGGNGSSGGQGPGDEKKVLAYLNERNTVIAEEARYQRTRRSPFDMSSPYTFLGSMAYSMIPFAYSSGGIMSIVKNTSSIATSSLASLTPTANAVDIEKELSSKGDCPLLETTGAVGDAFCNPYIITDTDTVGLKSDLSRGEGGIIDIKAGIDPSNFEADGYTVKEGSDLAKYITYCGQRTSQYGAYDASIAERSTNESVAGKIIGFVPILSDLQSIRNAVKDNSKRKWINGTACVVSEDNPEWMRTNKYFARYAENERLLENSNPGFKSTVTAYLEKYYEENPLDNSFEGTLARFSGMTKEKVENTLALIDYYQFLDQYRPEERYAFGVPAVNAEKELKFDNSNELASGYYILLNQISFADVRNRSFAV